MKRYRLVPVLELLKNSDVNGRWYASFLPGVDFYSDVRLAFVHVKEKRGPITPGEIETWCSNAIVSDDLEGGGLYGSYVVYRETGSSAWLVAWFIPVGHHFEGRLLVITSVETWLKHLQEKQDA